MFKPGFELPKNGRVVVHVEDYRVTRIEIIGKDSHIMTMAQLVELHDMAGFVSLHRDDIPDDCQQCEHRNF